MPNHISMNNPSERKAFVTGLTSGIGRATAFEVARHGSVVLMGRDCRKLEDLQKAAEREGGHALLVVCDLSDVATVRRAAAEIIALHLPIGGLVNNAGIHQVSPTKNARGWDMTFATNHLGPFALTEALMPHLPDGANVVFAASGVEDPERKPAKAAGFRGGRYISAEASSREWDLAAPRPQVQTPMPPRSSATLPPFWSLPVRLHACAPTRWNRASIQAPDSCATPMSSYASC
jgi:NAD(P)-dependent dehydrogenase (short-subunit alcohol dehydrogenase family)